MMITWRETKKKLGKRCTLASYVIANKCFYFRFIDNETSNILNLHPSSVAVQPCFCYSRTWSEIQAGRFLGHGSFLYKIMKISCK